MTHPLHGFTHLDAIGILAQAHLELRQDSRSSLRELSEASQVLRKAEEFQLTDEEQQWVIDMTRTRNPEWDPRIQEAYLFDG